MERHIEKKRIADIKNRALKSGVSELPGDKILSDSARISSIAY